MRARRPPFLDELAEHAGRHPRVLAWGQGGEWAVCLPDRFAYTRSGAWASVPWDEIDHGGWDQDSGVLSWTGPDGAAHEVALSEPGDVPDVFRELVAASILVQRTVTWDGGSAVLALRRNPADTGPARWRVLPAPGSDPDAPPVRRALAQARAEWDID